MLAEVAEARAAAGWAAAPTCATLDLLTIDPVDARDHDDAVHAAPDTRPAATRAASSCTWRSPTSPTTCGRARRLDREAQLRGNSVYFPDRVVPMLPERISNDLCSLQREEERPCLAVRMVFDRQGNKKGHTFLRGMMRSAAKLSYEEAQAAIDGQPSAKAGAAAGARAEAAVGGLRGAGRRPRPARAARPRPARAQDPARPAGPGRARDDAGSGSKRIA